MLGKLAIIASSILLSSAVNSNAFQQRLQPSIAASRLGGSSLSMNGGSQVPTFAPPATPDLKVCVQSFIWVELALQ